MTNPYITFNEGMGGKKTRVRYVRNVRSNDILGTIRWYSPWRQYCFMSSGGCIFNSGCLEDITREVVRLNDEHKQGNALLGRARAIAEEAGDV